MSKGNYYYERISKANISDLSCIAESAFGIPLDKEFLLKEYDTSCSGTSFIGYIAYSIDKQPAAFYGVFPVLCIINNEKVLLAQSGNTMTHKEHQGNGLFVQLAKLTYELCENENIKGVFGFPNENSLPGFQRKLEWQFNGHLLKYSKRVKTLPIAFLAFKYSFINSIYKKLYQTKINKREWFNSSIIEHGKDSIERSLSFWNYKTYHPNFTFNVGDVKVWAKINSTLYIGDIEFKKEVDYQAIIKGIIKQAIKLGCPKIVFQISEDHWLNQYLSNEFKQEKSLPFGYLKISSNCPELKKMQFTLADFDTF